MHHYPAALVAFEDLDDRGALAVLAKAPDPATAAKLSRSQLKAALRTGGRTHYLDATTRTESSTSRCQAWVMSSAPGCSGHTGQEISQKGNTPASSARSPPTRPTTRST